MNFLDSLFLAHYEGAPLIAAQEFTKLKIVEPWFPPQGAGEPTPEHRQATQNIRLFIGPVDGIGQHVDQARAHD